MIGDVFKDLSQHAGRTTDLLQLNQLESLPTKWPLCIVVKLIVTYQTIMEGSVSQTANLSSISAMSSSEDIGKTTSSHTVLSTGPATPAVVRAWTITTNCCTRTFVSLCSLFNFSKTVKSLISRAKKEIVRSLTYAWK